MPVIIGWAGADTLIGGAGDDYIIGGLGADRLTGGAGADRFRFNSWQDSRSDAPDTILDFTTSQDTIDLGGMTGLLFVRLLEVGSNTVLLAATTTGLMRINVVGRVANQDVRLPQGVSIERTTIDAGQYSDSLVGTHSSDGRDYVVGTSGPDTLNGTDGVNPSTFIWDDILDGQSGADSLTGGVRDIVYGGGGADVLGTGSASSTGGNAYLVGGTGSDRFILSSQPTRVTDFTTTGPDADTLVMTNAATRLQFSDGVQIGSWFFVGLRIADLDLRTVTSSGTPWGTGGAFDLGVSGHLFVSAPSRQMYNGTTSADHADYSDFNGPLVFLADFSSNGRTSTVYTTRFDPIYGLVADRDVYDTLTGFEMITGTRFSDTMVSDGIITLSGGGGDDRLIMYRGRGNSGATLYGGAGDDQLVGNGEDRLFGDDGQDWLQGGDFNDRLSGGEGNDLLDPGTGSNIVDGGTGIDTVVYTGARADYRITTINGETRVFSNRYSANGVQEFDILVNVESISFSDQVLTLGPPVYDYVYAPGVLATSDASNVLNRGLGPNVIYTGQGEDIIRYLALWPTIAQGGRDTLADFATGIDRIDLTALNPTSVSVVLVAEGTFVRGVVFAETPAGAFQTYSPNVINGNDFTYNGAFGVFVVGSSLADVILGSSRPDPLLGNDGDDVITGAGGADAIAGGAGRDTFVYLSASDSNATTGFDNLYDFTSGEDTINLRELRPTSVSIVRSENGSSFIFAESASGAFLTTAAQRLVQGYDIDHGGAFGVYMAGSTVADTLIGSARRDELNGGAGDDVLVGGSGADGLTGGSGADIFRYESTTDSTAAETDIIRDFVSGVDRIDLVGVRTGIEDRYGIAQLGTSSFLFVDLGGDGVNDMVIALTNTVLRPSDILWGTDVAALGQETTVKQSGPDVLPVEGGNDSVISGAEIPGNLGGFMLDLEGQRGFHGQDWYL